MALKLFQQGIRNHLSNLTTMFEDKSETVALKIPMMRCNEFLVKLHDYLIQEEGVSTVAREDDKLDFENRLILLNKSIDTNLSQIPQELKNWIESQKVETKKYVIVKDINTFSLEQALSKVIQNNNIDCNIKQETLKQFKIIELTPEQQQYKDKIASIILSKSSNSITTILEKKVIQDDNHFLTQSYQYLHGEKNSFLDIQEGSCKFQIDMTKIFINNLFQEERDRFLNKINISGNIINLFGDLILDTRLFKEKNAHVYSCVLSSELKQYFLETQKLNSIKQRSASRSLAKPVNQPEEIKGSLEVESTDIFTFMEDHLNNNKNNKDSQIFIISQILKDLSFISAFVGVRKSENKVQSETNEEQQQEQDKSIELFFYYLINEEDYKNKSLSELIIDNINQKIINLSENRIDNSLFKKSDIISVTSINSDISNKKLLAVNLQIRHEILNHSISLLNQVRTLYSSSIHYTNNNENNHQPQDIQEYEGDLQKKVKV